MRERERERDRRFCSRATSLHDSLEYLFTPSNEEYLSIPRCIQLQFSCLFFFFFLMEKWKENWRGWYEILRDTFNSFFFFCIQFFFLQAISKGSLSVWTAQMASGMDEGLYAITYCVVYCTFYVRKLISSSVDEENIVSLKELLWKQLDTII